MATHGVQEGPGPGFIDLLNSLSYEDQYKSKPRICYNRTAESEHSGVQRFIRELELQKNDHQRDTEQTRRGIKDKFQNELRQAYGFTGNFDELFEFIKRTMFELQQVDKIKADVDYPSSTWRVEHFEKYVKSLDISFIQPITQIPAQHSVQCIRLIPENDFTAIQQRYLELAPVYLDVPTSANEDASFLKELQKQDFHEPTTRLFVDALITPILRGNNMQVRLEEKLYNYKDGNPTLPNCIADYVIYNRDGEILGAIETKAGGYLKSESVIQCMLQLLALRRKAPHTLFGVVTDAVRYVFIVLTAEGTFRFERNGAAVGCYDINNWEDLRRVAGIFNALLQQRQNEGRPAERTQPEVTPLPLLPPQQPLQSFPKQPPQGFPQQPATAQPTNPRPLLEQPILGPKYSTKQSVAKGPYYHKAKGPPPRPQPSVPSRQSEQPTKFPKYQKKQPTSGQTTKQPPTYQGKAPQQPKTKYHKYNNNYGRNKYSKSKFKSKGKFKS